MELDPNDIKNTNTDKYITYEYRDGKGSIHVLAHKSRPDDYIVYNNRKLVFKSSRRQQYLDLWKYLLQQVLNTAQQTKVLIVGGGDQFLSNFLLKYPCIITIVDPLAYHYFRPDIKKLLKIKEYVSKTGDDLLVRKMVPLDMTLKEAIEDEALDTYDLILVDNFQDSLLYTTGMYDDDIPELYFKLLKQGGSLIINHRFGIPKHIDKKFSKAPTDIVDIARGMKDYYNKYKTALNARLNLIDHVTKGTTCIELYKKNYKNPLEMLDESDRNDVQEDGE